MFLSIASRFQPHGQRPPRRWRRTRATPTEDPQTCQAATLHTCAQRQGHYLVVIRWQADALAVRALLLDQTSTTGNVRVPTVDTNAAFMCGIRRTSRGAPLHLDQFGTSWRTDRLENLAVESSAHMLGSHHP